MRAWTAFPEHRMGIYRAEPREIRERFDERESKWLNRPH